MTERKFHIPALIIAAVGAVLQFFCFPIGGLIAWAIFNTLGCLIPGAIALYYIFKINKAASYDEQQQLLTNTKRILVVGTVLCVLNLIMQFGGRMS